MQFAVHTMEKVKTQGVELELLLVLMVKSVIVALIVNSKLAIFQAEHLLINLENFLNG
jgi:hypothetical protein